MERTPSIGNNEEEDELEFIKPHKSQASESFEEDDDELEFRTPQKSKTSESFDEDIELDPEIDTCIIELADDLNKKEFKPGLETVEVHALRMRSELRKTAIDAAQQFKAGYETIVTWFKANGIDKPQISEEGAVLLVDVKEFAKKINEGEAIYQLLGFSDDTMLNFYKAAFHFADTKDFEKGRDAFYFLTRVDQNVADYWLGLGICLARLKDYKSALDATLQALELDPTKVGSYKNAFYLFRKTKESNKARNLCDQGLSYARSQSQEPWAEKLIALLENEQHTMI